MTNPEMTNTDFKQNNPLVIFQNTFKFIIFIWKIKLDNKEKLIYKKKYEWHSLSHRLDVVDER